MIDLFLSYVSTDEKNLITEALENYSLSEKTERRMGGFLERFGSRKNTKF